MSEAREVTAFGRLLRYWRGQRGLSQLALATSAQTTPRHLSFVETGRSRPGRDLVLRLGECLRLAVRDRNALLEAAGLRPAYAERTLDDAAMRPYTAAVQTLLDHHEPFPGSASDPLGRVFMSNRAYRRVFGVRAARTPEQIVDGFFRNRGGFEFENWPEVGWAYADRWRLEASRSADPQLARLAARAEAHLKDVPRPEPNARDHAVVTPRLLVDGQTLSVFSTVLRFDTAREVTLSELRVELIFPADAQTEDFFRARAAAADARVREAADVES